MSTAKPTSTRVTNVQVPGAIPAAPEAAQPAAASEAVKQEAAAPGAADPSIISIDLEALTARIREEERTKARAELGAQIEAAQSVVGKPAESIARSQHDYRNMRADDIDPATLTAPVLTADGYLCPPMPEAKK
jgi:hypothetical protein